MASFSEFERKICEKFYLDSLTENQRLGIRSIQENKDVFLLERRREAVMEILKYDTMSLKHDEGVYLILKGDKKSDIHEGALSEFIDRVILSAAMHECGVENFGIMDAFDGQLVHPDNITCPNDDPNTGRSRPRKAERKGKKGKKTEKNENKNKKLRAEVMTDQSVFHVFHSTKPAVTFSATKFRDMVKAEIKRKARIIQQFYSGQCCQQQDERIQVYRDVFMLTDQVHKLEHEYEKCRSELLRFKTAYDSVSREMDAVKMAKRIRRNAAKQKRNHQQAKKSMSSSNAEMSLINAQNQSADVIETSGER